MGMLGTVPRSSAGKSSAPNCRTISPDKTIESCLLFVLRLFLGWGGSRLEGWDPEEWTASVIGVHCTKFPNNKLKYYVGRKCLCNASILAPARSIWTVPVKRSCTLPLLYIPKKRKLITGPGVSCILMALIVLELLH